MKKIIIMMMLALVPMMILAQDNNEERDSIRSNTKYGELFFRKGIFVKYEDFRIEKYQYTGYGNLFKIKTSIRKLYGQTKSYYFLKLRIGNSVVFIEYSDLVEINKALAKLMTEVASDCLKQPEYLRNKFITDDEFEIGYWIEKKSNKYLPTWYFDFDRFNRHWKLYSVEIDIEKVSKMFQEKQAQIEEMMASDLCHGDRRLTRYTDVRC